MRVSFVSSVSPSGGQSCSTIERESPVIAVVWSEETACQRWIEPLFTRLFFLLSQVFTASDDHFDTGITDRANDFRGDIDVRYDSIDQAERTNAGVGTPTEL